MDPSTLIADFFAALAAGETSRVVGFFAPDGVVVSPLYGARPAATFFAVRANDTERCAITPIRYFVSRDNVAAAQYLYRWTLVSGECVDFEGIDVFEFAGDGRIRKLTTVCDTHPMRSRLAAATVAARARLSSAGGKAPGPGRAVGAEIPLDLDLGVSSSDPGPRQRHAPGPDDLALSAEAQELLAALPPEERPDELARAYPRIVNAIASHRRNVRELEQYFASLLTLDRKDRHGFPFKVLMELESLKTRMLQQHNRPDPFWD